MNCLSTTSSLGAHLRLATLARSDTVHVTTTHSNYRICLLDPVTGRALVEGGRHFAEPAEAMVCGATTSASAGEHGEITTGLPLEIWTHDQLVCTSPVLSFSVEHQLPAPPISATASQESKQI